MKKSRNFKTEVGSFGEISKVPTNFFDLEQLPGKINRFLRLLVNLGARVVFIFGSFTEL